MSPPRASTPHLDASATTQSRLDLWLWYARFFKSRSLAAQAIEGGKVHVNDRRVKPALRVALGDRVAITRPGFTQQVAITKLPARRGPAAEAVTCYVESEASVVAQAAYHEQHRLAAACAPRPAERPDKHARRSLRRLRGRIE
jgi:ribosome-associated heat shock protein Hsp15